MNENKKIIDIILPNYNKKDYITECLTNLVRQTYPHWRCIVIDSFSNDGSWEIIQDFAKKDTRFELYQVPRVVKSVYEAWNFGLTKINSPYFAILTSDDLWEINWLENALDSLNKYPQAIAAAARTRIINSESKWGEIATFNLVGERFFDFVDTSPQIRKGIDSCIASYFIGPIYTSMHSLVIRSSILTKEEDFAEDLGTTADYQWYIKLGLYGDIIYHQQINAGWRIYSGQATQHSEQKYTGNYSQIIHQRMQEKIAERLGILGEKFLIEANKYDGSLLAYHYQRPYLINLFSQPQQELIKLLQVLSTMPKEVFLDFFYKFQGKYFFLEASLDRARKFYSLIQENQNVA